MAAVTKAMMAPHARWTMPAAQRGTTRTLYAFRGGAMRVGNREVPGRVALSLVADVDATIVNGPEPSELLLLQGRPIAEPVAQHGPFVMNTRDEIVRAFADYRATRFGGWPWPRDGPVHPREQRRFARHADGREDVPG